MNNNKFDNTKDYSFLAFCNELAQRCSKVSAQDIQIYSTMFDDSKFYEHHFGHYTPAHDDIALDCGVSRSTVIRSINNKLIPLGLVKVVSDPKGCASTYKIIDYRTVDGLFDRADVKELKQKRREEALAKREAYRLTQQPEPIAPEVQAVVEAVAAVAASLPEEPTTQICVDEPEQSAMQKSTTENSSIATLTLAEAQAIWKQEGKPAYIIKNWSDEFLNVGSFIRPTLNINWSLKND
ncbi:hypothetical protein E9863_10825 [Salmonella enterica]|uniref:hypothetical protein n=1 Tax=Salmonella enterica TaxID=28901 RepID=UPI0009AF2F1D|nr:hypothetical protein [Salmonella enterica]EAV6171739.1 hypothetical protein [Salmonella enterica subsp. enterica serovar Havana]